MSSVNTPSLLSSSSSSLSVDHLYGPLPHYVSRAAGGDGELPTTTDENDTVRARNNPSSVSCLLSSDGDEPKHTAVQNSTVVCEQSSVLNLDNGTSRQNDHETNNDGSGENSRSSSTLYNPAYEALFIKEFAYKSKQPILQLKKLPHKHKAVIFDIHQVLLDFKLPKIPAIEDSVQKMLKMPNLPQYLNGTMSLKEFILSVTAVLRLSEEEIENIAEIARETMCPIDSSIHFLHELKQQDKVLLICLSNCARGELAYIRRKFEFFDNFDVIFCSGDIGACKPHPDAINFVLKYCNLKPENVIFLDDDENNVAVASTLGLKTVRYSNASSLLTVQELLDETEEQRAKTAKNSPREITVDNTETFKYNSSLFRAYCYLTQAADLDENGMFVGLIGHTAQMLDSKQLQSEIFSSIYVLDLSDQLAVSSLGNRIISTVSKLGKQGKFKYFIDNDVILYDIDTTTSVLLLLHKHMLIDDNLVHAVIDEILANHDEQLRISTYFFSNNKPRYRVCPVVCCNALYLIHLFGREDNDVVRHTKSYVMNHLQNKAYYKAHYGSAYANGDFFLFSVSKLVHRFPNSFREFADVVKREINERIGTDTDNAVSLACRVISCTMLDIPSEEECNQLMRLQLEDGSWHENPIYNNEATLKYYYFANRAFTTALAMKAIELKTFGGQKYCVT